MADFAIKKTALQLLAINGILSDAEVNLCIEAISLHNPLESNFSATNSPDHTSSKKIGDILFEDSNISVALKGIEKNEYWIGTDDIEFKFIIHNKTPFPVSVYATQVTINDFVISNKKTIIYDAAPQKKSIESFSFDVDELDDVDVCDPEDIDEFEFAIRYEIDNLNIKKETKAIAIEIS